MGLVLSTLEIPLLTVYASTLKALQLFRPRKCLSGRPFHAGAAAGIWPEEWSMDTLKPGMVHVIEGSTKDDQTIYIEVVVQECHCVATIVLGDVDGCLGGQFTGAWVDERTVKCGPLFLEMREPFRRWRVNFKGYLGNEDDRKFVTLAGWWKPTSDARFFYADLPFSGLKFAKPVGVSTNLDNISRLHNSGDLTQFGLLHLELTVDGETGERRYRGSRQITDVQELSSSREFSVYLQDGNRLSYKSVVFEDDLKLNHGIAEKASLLGTTFTLTEDETSENVEREFRPADGKPIFGVLPNILRSGPEIATFSYTSSAGHNVDLKWIQVDHSLTSGIAILRTLSRSSVEKAEFNARIEDVIATICERIAPVVPFSLRSCQDKEFTGGKGANLAKLTSMTNGYSVPSGAVVTITAFNNFLESNDAIRRMVKELGRNGLGLEKYVQQGESIAEAIRAATPPEYLKKLLEEAGIRREVKYAVRSSAVGEDGSDLSSAGQLESVLNVTFEQIPEKILECWCSNFRREVITYRRNYGQVLNPSMAVVIQEMIVNGVAGVMFSCDPVKNDDGKMIINAIKGCGEDIVSGIVTPDEIVVEKKTMEIVKPQNCCLEDVSLKNLINAGLYLEKKFGTAQDIEFVVRDHKAYLVQSRDVTGRDRESRFELLTEFDSATLSDQEIITTANVGEVVPEPLTPYEVTGTSEYFDRTMTNMCLRDIPGCRLPRHSMTVFFLHGQRLLFNIGEMFMRMHAVIRVDRLPEIIMAGDTVFNDTMFNTASIRYGPLPRFFLLKRIQVVSNQLFSKSYKLLDELKTCVRQTEQLAANGEESFEQILDILGKQKDIYRNILEQHCDASQFSSFTYMVVGNIIRGSGDGTISPETLSDLANIFSNSTTMVLSADVPSSLKKLARAIRDDGLQDEFSATTDSEAYSFILKNGQRSAEQMRDFMKLHGHRGPKECYIRANSWGDKPEILMLTLKTMLKSDIDEKEENSRSADELVDSLKCKPTGLKRWLIKYMVRQAHRGVATREQAKSCLVKSCFELRKTTMRMAKMLCEKGLLPEEDLMFFMTMDEILQLYKYRSAKVIARAMRRRQIFPEFGERQYAHLYHGNPEPINNTRMDELSTTVSLGGTVVCEGKVVARARVAANLEEAKHTQPGEILITRCTDICWSPFFPIIKGIVTEIGGLLSHGAVVAREYGLPSLIAVEHATSVFKTGDLVELDTFRGIISKIEEKES